MQWTVFKRFYLFVGCLRILLANLVFIVIILFDFRCSLLLYFLGNMKTPTRKIATQMIPTGHFPPRKLPSKKISTQDNFHPDISHPENSRPA